MEVLQEFLGMKKYYLKIIKDKDQRIAELEQKLKEKDNLIEFGREEIRKRNKRIDEIVERDKKLFDDKNKELEKLKQQLEEKDKEKTQLAIQELEKVKKWVADHTQDFWNCENDDLDTELYELIDNQIKELKGVSNETSTKT